MAQSLLLAFQSIFEFEPLNNWSSVNLGPSYTAFGSLNIGSDFWQLTDWTINLMLPVYLSESNQRLDFEDPRGW
jgi:hypothetical protein